ncbi:MAG: hypothetical protein QOJ74_1265, partial [Ilumatobacteraceae bacterium]|nr:hypothetical protein [Ilumatobacteraceae bacterium]
MAELRAHPRQWDELVDAHGNPRPAALALVERLRSLEVADLQERQSLAEVDILALGITFTVYHDGQGTDRAWPMDIIPRVIAASEWAAVELGLKQRLSALNRFIDDVYHDRRVVADGVFPAELLEGSVNLRPECSGMSPKFGVWAHICGTDLVRDANGVLHVLEDNLRVPSGVSYLLQNRAISKRAFADLFERQSILPVDDYPDRLRRLLLSLAS